MGVLRPRTTAIRVAVGVALLASLAAAAAAPAAARVPPGFVGVMLDGPILGPSVDPAREARAMVASGVESVRIAVHWSDAQPYERIADVPHERRPDFRVVHGVPTDFTRLDALVATAARRHLRVLPVITTAPSWAATHPGQFASPPADPAEYARFARTLAERYGPGGDLWTEVPSLPRRPVRAWQLWNEPNLRSSWLEASWPRPYVELLRAGRRALRQVDPRARIVLAGLANYSWRSLAAIYRVPGARRLFDTVAVHPYTREVPSLVTILRRVRRVMRRAGDRRKPVAVTEFSWPSAKGKAVGFGIETTERGQARRVAASLRVLARERDRLRLTSAYYYTWLGPREQGSDSIFTYSGLRRLDASGAPEPKPALRAFRRTALRLERCARKAPVATRCARRLAQQGALEHPRQRAGEPHEQR